MDTTNNTLAVNLLDSPANSEQDSSSTTNSVIDSATTSAFNLSTPIDPERIDVSDKPLSERSVGEKKPNLSQSEQLVKFDKTYTNEESGNTLSSLSSRRESPAQRESMLDGRAGSQRVAAEIKLANEIELSINKAVNNKNQKTLDQLLQQHNVHGDTILAGNALTLALETAIYREESMAISLINAGVGVKYENERGSKSGLATALSREKHTVAEALLQKGASVEGCSYDVREPLLITIEHGDLKGFELLLKYKPVLKFGFLRTALKLLTETTSSMKVTDPAKRAAILRMAKVLINAGVNIKVHVKGDEVTDAPILKGWRASGFGGIDLNKDEGSLSALIMAIDLNDIDLIKLLLDKGYDVNAGRSYRVNAGNPLCVATLKKNKYLVQLLLKYGADVNAFFSHPLGKNPVTPLAAAITAIHPNMDIILLLVKNKAIVHRCLFNEYPTSMISKNIDSQCNSKTLTLSDIGLNNMIKLCEMNNPNDWSKIEFNIKSLSTPETIENDLFLRGWLSFNKRIYNMNVLAKKQKQRPLASPSTSNGFDGLSSVNDVNHD